MALTIRNPRSETRERARRSRVTEGDEAPHTRSRAVEILRAHEHGAGACVIGRVTDEPGALVTMTSRIGASRIVDMLSGEQLPRIC